MSSGVESGGVVAAAVMLPVGMTVGVAVGTAVGSALGVGWLAWQGGKLLVEANRAADRQIAEKKRQLEKAAMHRKRAALAAHRQLVDLCTQLIVQLEKDRAAAGAQGAAELKQIEEELRDICSESIPDDAAKLESGNALGFLKLEQMVARQQYLSALQMESSEAGAYRGLSLADLMRDLRIAMDAMKIQATEGKDVQAADPMVLERVKLDEKLADVTARIMEALEYIAELSSAYGLSASGSAWFHSCFNGVDEQIEALYMPSTSNAELKRGIKRLEEVLEQYDMLVPDIESEQKKLAALYQVYVDASRALGEPVADIRSFRSSEALEERLRMLQKRAERAEECARIYQMLGPEAYICYAWDQELRALGYEVHTRKEITEMAGHRPQNAKLGESRLPFYQWSDDDLTQLYSMASECSLQVIVHEDGSVTMQAISDAEDEEAKAVQTGHCSLLAKLHEGLRRNWFVLYDYQETASPDEVTSAAAWFGSEESAWKPDRADQAIGRRNQTKQTEGERMARQS